MGLTQSGANENFALKLLSLKRPEIEELLTFLFRKLGYSVNEVKWEGDLLYFHILKQEGILMHHALTCWTGGTRILSPDFLQSFLKTPPFTLKPEASFEKGFFLSPYEFHADFRNEAERNSIQLINGQTLSDLLAEHQLTYYFPSFLEIIGRKLWRLAPIIIPALLLLYGIFVYLTLKPEHAPPIATTPAQTPATEASPPSNPSSPQVSLVNPSFAVNIQEPNEIYKRMDPIAMAPVTKKPKETPNNEPPENTNKPAQTLVHNPPQNTLKPHTATRRPKHPSTPPGESTFHVLAKYNKVVDLEEKYFSIAKDLEKNHHNAKAKTYYQKYLKIAPDGDYADAAREALKRMK